MRAVIQRCNYGSVTSEGEVTGSVKKGLVVLLAVGKEDENADLEYIVSKILNLRIFEDAAGKLNFSVQDIKGDILVISQFTLYGDCRKGRRPSFTDAAPPEKANRMYETAVLKLRESGLCIETGRFQTHMKVLLENDGPVTILLDSGRGF
ncbi:MAG: D-aminoacyl-tRNA deacylase [Dialister sp.]|nr:D-aminoacyl-tRNA deacylase [Dialister sp.]